MLSAPADFRQSHRLFNPVKPVVVLPCDTLLNLLESTGVSRVQCCKNDPASGVQRVTDFVQSGATGGGADFWLPLHPRHILFNLVESQLVAVLTSLFSLLSSTFLLRGVSSVADLKVCFWFKIRVHPCKSVAERGCSSWLG